MEQHYRMTLQDAIAKYHAGDITIKGLIHFLENGSLDTERQKFTQWAEAANAIWGMES